MISVIICSANTELLEQLKANIGVTIGVPFEIIAIDNNIAKKSISAVYNEAAETAKFNCLCFLHEDIIIHTKGWGEKLFQLLADERIGLVGVSGAIYKSKYAGTWASCDKTLYRTHSIQRFKGLSEPVITSINPDNGAYAEVIVIDGVFMVTRKNVFDEIKFDEHYFTGFHAYDLDYSFQVGARYKVIVTFEILLEHFSAGQLNKQWLEASNLLHQKWKKLLPVSSLTIDKNAASVSDYLACSLVLMITIKHGGSKLAVIKHYLRLMTIFFRYNRLRHTRVAAEYLIAKRRNAKEN